MTVTSESFGPAEGPHWLSGDKAREEYVVNVTLLLGEQLCDAPGERGGPCRHVSDGSARAHAQNVPRRPRQSVATERPFVAFPSDAAPADIFAARVAHLRCACGPCICMQVRECVTRPKFPKQRLNGTMLCEAAPAHLGAPATCGSYNWTACECPVCQHGQSGRLGSAPYLATTGSPGCI